MSQQKKRTILLWALYALFFLLILLLQDVVLGKYSLRGVRLCLIPMAAAAVAVQTGPDKGGLFCLFAGIFWALSGADDGGAMVFFMTFTGTISGYLCVSYFHPRLLPSVLLSVLSLALTLGPVYLAHIYLEGLSLASLGPFGWQMLFSLPFSPVFYWCCKVIRKAGP